MAQKTILVTGGSGYLGRYLTAKAAERFRVYATYDRHARPVKLGQPLSLDLSNRDETLHQITELSPQAIIHAAAINPGRGSQEEMMRINAAGSRYVAEGAVAVGARLVHVSSDVVHSGRDAPYDDDAPPSPINAYGRSKAAAEAAVVDVDPRAAIVRTSLIYGLDEIDRGTESLVKRLDAGETLTLFNDVIRQPVWVETLSEALLRLIDANVAGPLNVAGRQALTREEFGRRMLAWWQVDYPHKIQLGRATDISDTIPLDLRLSVTKAEHLLQMTFPGVDEVLAHCRSRP